MSSPQAIGDSSSSPVRKSQTLGSCHEKASLHVKCGGDVRGVAYTRVRHGAGFDVPYPAGRLAVSRKEQCPVTAERNTGGGVHVP